MAGGGREPSQKIRTAGGGDQSVNVSVGALGGEQVRKIPIKTPTSAAKWIGTMIGACMVSLAGGHVSGRLLAAPAVTDTAKIAEDAAFKQAVRDKFDALDKDIARLESVASRLEDWLNHRPH